MDAFAGDGEGGGFGSMMLPLAAFAAGFASPERAGAAFQNLRATLEQQERSVDRVEDRKFREKQFAASERERKDVGQTRAQQRESAAAQLAQVRAQQQAGQLLPSLQFSKEISVGQPEIPPQFGTSDLLRDKGITSIPGMPGSQTTAQVPQTVEDMRKQIMALSGAEPDVRAELFEKLRGFNVPLTQPKEPDEIQRARHAAASEQFLSPTVGALPARRMSELIKSGAAQLPPEVLQRAVSGDVRAVDLGNFVQFFDLATKKPVATLPKSAEPRVQVVDDSRTGKKAILFVDPRSRDIKTVPTDIPSGGEAGPDTERFLVARVQGVETPTMPPWIRTLSPEQAKEAYKMLQTERKPSLADQFLKPEEAKKPSAKGKAVPTPKAAVPKLRLNPATGKAEPVE